MDPIYKKIVEQATKLAERSISAFEAEQRLKEIEPEFKNLKEKVASLEDKISKENTEFRAKVNKMADALVTRGILEDSQKVAFVDSIVENPQELTDVVIKLSSELRAETFGKAAEQDSSDFENLDAFERLVLEN